jgi:hypothetical protein
LEGRFPQERRLLGTSDLYRLIKGYFLVFALAWQKFSHAVFAPADKSFHLKAKAATHEVSYSQKVYLIGLQKGTVLDKNGRIVGTCHARKENEGKSDSSVRLLVR